MPETIFDAGALYYKKRAAVAAYDVAVAQYKRTVLNAFQSVADSLKALELDAVALRHTKEQLDAAQNGFRAVTLERQAGSVSYLDLLIAEKAYENALLTLAQAQASRFSDTVALFQALGGGWTPRQEKTYKAILNHRGGIYETGDHQLYEFRACTGYIPQQFR